MDRLIYLLTSTLIWSFSFSLIEGKLQNVDPYLAVLIRSGLALLFFLPFTRSICVSKTNTKLIIIGSIQLGLMYCFYFNAFKFISVNEILLFNILTPIYIIAIDNYIKNNKLRRSMLAVVFSIFGAYVIRETNLGTDVFVGFLLIQGANLCFAVGQVLYKEINLKNTQKECFAYFYFGAFWVSVIAYAILGDKSSLIKTDEQLITLIYLGVVASGLGYYLWNKGLKLVTTTQLAIANNLLIPVGILVNVIFWNGEFNLIKLTIGSVIIIATLYFDIRKVRNINLNTE